MANNTPGINIEIKTVSLSGKKMTKSLFSQIEMIDCFGVNMNFFGDELYGFVVDKNNKYLLWQRNGLLRKTNLSPYYRWLWHGNDLPTLELVSLLKKYSIWYNYPDRSHSINFQDGISDIGKYNELVTKLRVFLNELNGKQIYI